MLEEEYKQFLIPQAEYDDGYDLTIKIDTSTFPQTQKISKKDTEEVSAQKREDNDQKRS